MNKEHTYHCLTKRRERSEEIAKNNKGTHVFGGSHRVDSTATPSSSLDGVKKKQGDVAHSFAIF
jgi:hypothetical protein